MGTPRSASSEYPHFCGEIKKYFIWMYLLTKDMHYENTPIQIYRKFHLQKLKIFI